jgi:hypothetical protein
MLIVLDNFDQRHLRGQFRAPLNASKGSNLGQPAARVPDVAATARCQ